uniref:N-acetylneuraminate lyase n=1 Tax=Amblyomma aureolatum TaxID=187763 RepID=A0A1E1X9I1_9ACAR
MEAKIAKIHKYSGLCAAPLTLFDVSGHVDTSRIEDYVKLLRQQSVTGAFVNGTTGEGLSLTVAERKGLAEAWVRASRGRLDLLIVHITAASVVDTRELAAHAEGLNVDAISVLPPFYYRCPSSEHLIRYIEEVSKAAPNTPIIYYHIPSFTCVDVRMSELLPEAKRRVPALCGAKYSCTDMSDLAGFLRADKAETKIFFGYEELLLAALAMGVTAAIGGTFTYQGHLAKKIVDLYEKGDVAGARIQQGKLKHGFDTLCKHGHFVASLKAAASKVSGLNFGDPRVPIFPLSHDKAEQLVEEIRELRIVI